MHVLILGGTVFLGRILAEVALARDHTLTLFNRGQSNPGLFSSVETLHGDRKVDLSALNGRRWDLAIDTSGYVPRIVRNSARQLADTVEHYTFVSSLSVYAEPFLQDSAEDAAVATLPDPASEAVTGETYGALKALCEQVAENEMPGRVFVPRPGLIVGPHDPTDRFTYWPHRIAQGGEVLAPGRPGRPIQFIDVRDLSEWILRMAETRQTGAYNAVGPTPLVTMGEMLDACRSASRARSTLTWVDEQFLSQQQVAPWSELPAWVPENDPSTAGFFSFDNRKALAAGLTFRSVMDTAQAALRWDAQQPATRILRAGLSCEREAQLLDAWHIRRSVA